MGEGRQPRSKRFWSKPYECERMSYWRWLLFATMARLELTEDLYLRIPNGKTIRHDVTVNAYSDGGHNTLDKVSHPRLAALINRKQRKR